ncbi:MAG: hypothetical protein WBQ79_07300, partial [Acidobacteriaceae bacterium]
PRYRLRTAVMFARDGRRHSEAQHQRHESRLSPAGRELRTALHITILLQTVALLLNKVQVDFAAFSQSHGISAFISSK